MDSQINRLGAQDREAVFVRIFDGEGKPVISDRISDFRYKHSEKADDYSVVTIHSLDVTLPDREAFQEHRVIFFNWGYIGGSQRTEKLYIMDSKPEFNEEGVTLVLECYDRLAYLKLTQKTLVIEDQDVEGVLKQISEQFDLKLDTTDPPAPGIEFSNIDPTNTGSTVKDSKPSLADTKQNQIKSLGAYSTNSSTLETTPVSPGVTGINFKIPATEKKDHVIGNESVYRFIAKLVENLPGGPYVLTGRGDNMIIRPRNFNKKPYRYFGYRQEPGDLLSFSPEIKNKAQGNQSLNLSMIGFDPTLKETLLAKNIPHKDNETQLNTTEIDPKLYLSTKDALTGKNALEKWQYNPNKVTTSPYPKAKPEIKGSPITESSGILESPNPTVIAITGISQSLGNSFDKLGELEKPIITNDTGFDFMGDFADNYRKSKALENNPGTIVTLGDPFLESSQVITIGNVGKKFSGNYYLIEVEHHINEQGYTCTGEIVRQGHNLLGPGRTSNQALLNKVNNLVGKKPTKKKSKVVKSK